MTSFPCQRCGACCKQSGFVYLKEEDAKRLAAHLGIEIYHFTEAYCLLMDRRHLALKKRTDETCLFLGANGCEVYPARPAQCRDFPLGWKTERSSGYCKGMKKT
ncbi:MAG: YkgJ family cysteine cluster protein [Candidatus Omnitrophota bacterium]